MDVAAGDVERDVRLRTDHGRQRAAQVTEVFAVAGAALQTDVQRSARLERRIVVFGVHRKREDALVALEQRRRAVTVMRVAVNHRRAVRLNGSVRFRIIRLERVGR